MVKKMKTLVETEERSKFSVSFVVNSAEYPWFPGTRNEIISYSVTESCLEECESSPFIYHFFLKGMDVFFFFSYHFEM